jgi:hypothetical protein
MKLNTHLYPASRLKTSTPVIFVWHREQIQRQIYFGRVLSSRTVVFNLGHEYPRGTGRNLRGYTKISYGVCTIAKCN